MVKVLLSHNADPNRTTTVGHGYSGGGSNALALASMCPQSDRVEGGPPLIRALLDAKADVHLGHPKSEAPDETPRNIGLSHPLLAAVKTGSEVLPSPPRPLLSGPATLPQLTSASSLCRSITQSSPYFERVWTRTHRTAWA